KDLPVASLAGTCRATALAAPPDRYIVVACWATVEGNAYQVREAHDEASHPTQATGIGRPLDPTQVRDAAPRQAQPQGVSEPGGRAASRLSASSGNPAGKEMTAVAN
ncbi:MAG: hypothetical protein M0T79_15160, partial [Actinomycetota bacterium]|nr:hypothetical protein [Actinomycetota bacterium]